MESARADDPMLLAHGEFLQSWAECIGVGDAVTAAEAVKKAMCSNRIDIPVLYEVLTRMFDDRSGISTLRMGRYLMQHKGRIVNGLRFARHPVNAHGGVVRWLVERPKAP
jgi:hypothetical protein